MFWKGVLQFVILYRDIFSRCLFIWGSTSKTTKVFWNILSSSYWLQSIRKSDARNLCLFVYLRSYNDKSKFSFLQTVQSSGNTSYLGTDHFWRKYWNRFLDLIFLYTLKKNPVKKLSKVLKMELKTYTPVGQKFVFEKIKFKILHYIQHDFIWQRPGFSKDQINMFKSLVIH